MTEKRMLIVPVELGKKIDDNRGDMSNAEFIDFLIDSQLKQKTKDQQYVTKEEIDSLIDSRLKQEAKDQKYASKEEVYSFEQDMKKLLRSFLDFFINYGLELGKESRETEFGELTSKLQGLQKDLDSDSEKGKATIKWK